MAEDPPKQTELSNMEKLNRSNPWKDVNFHQKHHGKKFKFIDEDEEDFNVINCRINKSKQYIFLKQLFDCRVLTKVTLEFTIKNCNANINNTLSLIQYPLHTIDNGNAKYVNINGHKITESTVHSFETNQFRSAHLKNEEYKLIMALKCNSKKCDIYVNEMNNNYLLHTINFKKISKQFVVAFGSSALLKSKSKTMQIQIKLLQLIDSSEDIQIKRNKKKKPKKRRQSVKSVTLANMEPETKENQSEDTSVNDNGKKKSKKRKQSIKSDTIDSENKNESMDNSDKKSKKKKSKKQKQSVNGANVKKKSNKKRKGSEPKKEETKPEIKSKQSKKKKKPKIKTNKSDRSSIILKKSKTSIYEYEGNGNGSDDDIDVEYDWSSMGGTYSAPEKPESDSDKPQKSDKSETQKRKTPKKRKSDSDKSDDSEQQRRKSKHKSRLQISESGNRRKKKKKQRRRSHDHSHESHSRSKGKLKPKKKSKKRRKSAQVSQSQSKKLNKNDSDSDEDIDVEYDWAGARARAYSGSKQESDSDKSDKSDSEKPKNRLKISDSDSDKSDESNTRKHKHKHRHKKKKKAKKRRKSAQGISHSQSKKLRKKHKKRRKSRSKHRSRGRHRGRHRSKSQNRGYENEEESDENNELEPNGCVSDFEAETNPKTNYKIRINDAESENDSDTMEYAFETPNSPNAKGLVPMSMTRAHSLPPRRAPPPSAPPKLTMKRRSSKPERPSAPPPSQYLKDAYKELDILQRESEPAKDCYVIHKCVSIKRIKVLLDFYARIVNSMHGKNEIIINYCSKYTQLLNDYHHILYSHLSGNKRENDAKFAMIYEILTDGNECFCDLNVCNAYVRNNRNRDNEQRIGNKDKYLLFYIDILDTIHCHLLHAFDAGFIIKYDSEEEKEQKDNGYSDYRLSVLHKKVYNRKYKLLQKVRGPRIQNNKFINDFRHDNFGYKFWYWPYYRDSTEVNHSSMYVEPKYSNLKEEIMYNHIFPLDKKVYLSILTAAEVYSESIYVKTCIKQETEYAMCSTKERICLREGIDKLFYGISSYQSMTIEHIMSIYLYCNYAQLNIHFRDTFKKSRTGDSISVLTKIKEKHREFAVWSRLLRESVEIYGEWISTSKNHTFYTSIGESKVLFNQFQNCVNIPMSTSTDLSIIALYSNCNGYVLELSENRDNAVGLFVKYFNTSFFSNFSFEQERIFIGGYSPLTFGSILSMDTMQNYSVFLRGISIFKSGINGQQIKNKPSKMDYKIIDKLVSNELGTDKSVQIPIYPQEIFHFVITKQTNIQINGYNIETSYPKLKKFFISPFPSPLNGGSTDNNALFTAEMVSFTYLTNLCPECTHISICMTNSKNAINQSYLALLSQIMPQLNETNLQTIKFENIRNKCTDKELKRFKSVLNGNKLKWSLHISAMDGDRYRNKYEYSIVRKDAAKQKKTLVNKMKNMFGQK